MKCFSSLIVFVMMFMSLSVACADVALPPRPRNVQNDFITADIDDDRKLTLKFEFPAACDYEYQLIDRWEDNEKKIHYNEVKSGSGSCKAGDVVEEVVDLSNRIMGGKNYFLLNIQLSNVKEETRFGVKVRHGKSEIKKTIVISKTIWGKIYDLKIYNGTMA